MDLALKFNNLGVDLFNCGGRKEAWQLFKAALEVKLFLTRVHNPPADFIRQSLQDNDHIRAAYQYLTDRDSLISDTKLMNSQSTGPQDNFAYFVYLRGMKIRDEMLFKQAQNTSQDIFSAIILYNVALVDHAECLEGPDSKSKITLARLNKATKLYNMALDLILTEPGATDLRVLTTNNLGAIYFELGDYSNAAQYFAQLRSSLSDETYQNESNKVVTMDSGCLLYLTMNVLYLREPTLASAA